MNVRTPAPISLVGQKFVSAPKTIYIDPDINIDMIIGFNIMVVTLTVLLR